MHHRDDLDLDVTWTFEGDNVTMQETFLGAAIDYTGYAEGNTLHLFNGDPQDDLTCEYVYERQ